jgi:hypothetical protein
MPTFLPGHPTVSKTEESLEIIPVKALQAAASSTPYGPYALQNRRRTPLFDCKTVK